ncbi:unnamed protein product (macronuclear) [Paramecium tetraurelia]|uniref:Uncharacterized protein n=1 Tax=Paramecium tetraurelia TaxID=5888 RepID=A0E8I1_PARTE|nr:uncharacterized protein GSPATT00024327001 [Paramecium tetraurelia]CAK91598.1 unnamed protein product [Paramecium tetraurelia]|eukprot:XP_001458995.1 hypothetical protein (macronuclear) [Paramecium tetraurelia strain d4-2]
MKPIKIKNNENENPLPMRSKLKRINIASELFDNPVQFNISPLRLKVENDAQQYLEAIKSNRKRKSQKLEDTDFGAWQDQRYMQPNSNQYRQSFKKEQKSCQFKIRQQSPKIQQQNKITNKIIQYPLTGYLERNLNQFFQKDKYFKIIQNMTGATHRKKTKKIIPNSTQNSRAQSSLSFQL